MKWCYYLLATFFLFACKTKEKQQPVKTDTIRTETESYPAKPVSYNDTVTMPFYAIEDSGYFKGYIPEKITAVEESDDSHQYRVLSGIISKKQIKLETDETLSHTVLIDQGKKMRYDTLRNKHCTLISVLSFGNKESQKILINGKIAANNTGPDDTYVQFNAGSFRHFSFRGNEYYYLNAKDIGYPYGSIHTLTYHFIHDLKNNRLTMFSTCRFSRSLFGDVNGDERLDYLEYDNSGFCPGTPYSDEVSIHLYSVNDKGEFVLQKDNKGEPYFIDGNTGIDFSNDSFNIKKHYWPWLSK